MPNFTNLPAYPYGPKAPFPHGDANDASEKITKAHNADEGSNHAPTGTSAWSGSMGFGWSFADAFPFTGELTVDGGALNFVAATSGAISVANQIETTFNGPLILALANPGDTVYADFQSGVFCTWDSGSTSSFLSGSTLNLLGTTVIGGTPSLTAPLTISGSGSITVNAGRTITVNGSLVIGASGGVTYAVGATVAGTIVDSSFITRSGTGARTAHRAAHTLGDAAEDVTVAFDRYNLPSTQAADRVYTLRHTGTVPTTGQRIKVSRFFESGAAPAHTAKFAREDNTVVFSFYISTAGDAEFEYDGSKWILIHGNQSVSGASGFYDDVWT